MKKPRPVKNKPGKTRVGIKPKRQGKFSATQKISGKNSLTQANKNHNYVPSNTLLKLIRSNSEINLKEFLSFSRIPEAKAKKLWDKYGFGRKRQKNWSHPLTVILIANKILIEKGNTLKDVCKSLPQYGISASERMVLNINNITGIRGIKEKSHNHGGITKKLSLEDKNKIIALDKQNISKTEIAKTFGVSSTTIQRIVDSHYGQNL